MSAFVCIFFTSDLFDVFREPFADAGRSCTKRPALACAARLPVSVCVATSDRGVHKQPF